MNAALVLLLLSAADGGFAWEAPPKIVSDVAIAGQLEAGGIPVRMRKITVQLPAAEVGEHFLRSFQRQGLFVPPGQPYDRVLTGVLPSDFRTFTVLIQQIDARHCGVILGEAQPLKARGTAVADPLFPGATHAFETRFESGRTVSYRVRATDAELGSFYSDVLPRAGYLRAESSSWRSKTQEVSILSTPDPAQPTMLSVVMIWRLRAADEEAR